MRRILALSMVLAPGLVLAQDLATARIMMDGALGELASHDRVTFVLTGTVKDGNRTTSFSTSTAAFFTIHNGRQFAQLEALNYKNSELVSRMAGDGERFWDYDLKSKTYTSAEYGTARYAGAERDRLFQNMNLRMTGEQTFLARLFKDAFGGNLNASTAWVPWRSNANVSVQGQSIVCTSSVPNKNVLTYHLNKANGFGWSIGSIDYYEESVISTRTRITQWSVAIYRDQLPQSTSWAFVPPAGSRAVSVSDTGG